MLRKPAGNCKCNPHPLPGLDRRMVEYCCAASTVSADAETAMSASRIRRATQLGHRLHCSQHRSQRDRTGFHCIRRRIFQVGYSESLFLALALASVLAARVNRWPRAGLLRGFCWLTRATGAVLVPALTVEATQQYSTIRRWSPRWLWIALVPAGFAAYLGYKLASDRKCIRILADAKHVLRAIVCVAYSWHLQSHLCAISNA